MDVETFVTRVMSALSELDPEEKELPNIRKLFESDTREMFEQGWSVQDAIRCHRLMEHIDCWTKNETGEWVPKNQEDMIPEDVALAGIAKLKAKYK